MEKIKSFILNRQNWLFLLCLVLLGIIFFLWRGNTEYKDKLKALQAQDKQKEKMIVELEKKEALIQKSKDSLAAEVELTQKYITELINQRDEKITNIKRFTPSEHHKFFAEWVRTLPKATE